MPMFGDSKSRASSYYIIGPNAKYQMNDTFTVKEKYNCATFFNKNLTENYALYCKEAGLFFQILRPN